MTRTALLTCAIAALPALGGAPDTAVVEFYNAQTGHYFVTATASEAWLVDTGAAGPGWMRTGRSFQAWLGKSAASAGAQPVCRFYSTAANSHFYTASSSECASLQAQASAERSATGTVRGWQYEGVAYYVQAAAGGTCPSGTTPITRAYNNGFATGEGSNHRYLDDSALGSVMANDHWTVEGVAFCAPTQSTGTQAVLPSTTTAFDALVGTWTGKARFEVETNSGETEAVGAFDLTIAADGKVTGGGEGCKISGTVSTGDGFRSLFKGTASVTGCTNPALNGDGQVFRLQRFGTSMLRAQLHQETSAAETTISAVLTNGTAPTPPGQVTDFSLVSGDWKGTVGFEAEGGGAEVEGNKPLSLSISTAGAVTGTGFGCTFSGTLSMPANGRAFTGSVTAAGCEVALFNGTFDSVRVFPLGGGRLRVSMERQDSSGEAQVEGTLLAAGGNATPPTPPPPTTIAGSFQGTLSFVAGTASGSAKATLTIGADGSVSGAADTCTFTGTVMPGMAGSAALSGSITVAGCATAALNGTYDHAALRIRDGGALEVELERESHDMEVRIFGVLQPKA